MTEEVAQPVVATEPVPEPVPIPEPLPETSTAQRVEPLDPEPISEPQPTLEPISEPSPAPESIQVPEPASQPSLGATAGMAESAQLPPTPTEPIPEPVSTPSTSSPQETPTPTPEPVSAPQPQVSTLPVIQTSLARELLVKAREIIQFRKRKKLEKIMGLFLKKQSVTNDDVQKLLYVSDATATRYLQQLEKEGKIRKQGVPGHTSYSRI